MNVTKYLKFALNCENFLVNFPPLPRQDQRTGTLTSNEWKFFDLFNSTDRVVLNLGIECNRFLHFCNIIKIGNCLKKTICSFILRQAERINYENSNWIIDRKVKNKYSKTSFVFNFLVFYNEYSELTFVFDNFSFN